MEVVLLFAGLLFPAISWLSFGAALLLSRKQGMRSGMYVPIVGPLFLTLWLISSGHRGWLLAAPWIADIGTLLFAISAPSLIKEFWNYSRYTRVMLLTGTANDQQVEISLHKGSRYVLKRRWKRSPGELGVVALSEPGTFQEGEGGLTLLSHAGRPRMLAYDGHDYVVADSGDSSHYNLNGWRLRANA